MDTLEELCASSRDPKVLLATLSDYISRLEDYISGLDEKAEQHYRKLRESDAVFLRRLDSQARQLVEVQKALSTVKEKFEKSSHGALRVGMSRRNTHTIC